MRAQRLFGNPGIIVSGAAGDDDEGDPSGMLKATDEARRKLEAKLRADEESKRDVLRRRLASRQREKLQDLQASE